MIKTKLARDGSFMSKAGKAERRLCRPGGEPEKLTTCYAGTGKRYGDREGGAVGGARHGSVHRLKRTTGCGRLMTECRPPVVTKSQSEIPTLKPKSKFWFNVLTLRDRHSIRNYQRKLQRPAAVLSAAADLRTNLALPERAT